MYIHVYMHYRGTIYIHIYRIIYIYISINSSCEAWSLIVLFVPQTLLSDEC